MNSHDNPHDNPHDRVKILLVDDQPGKLLSYEAILGELGHRLIKASSAREALELLLKNEIAVILIDVVMPELDGFDLATLIREHPRYRSTAIILVSAVLLTDPDRLKGYDSGALDYVTVPVIPEVLRAKVKIFVELYRKGRMLEALNRDLEDRVARRTAELENSNQQLRESEERFRLASEAVQGGISDWDLVSGTARRSDGLLALLGFRPSDVEAESRWWSDRIHADDRQGYSSLVNRALEGDARTYRAEYRAEHRDGRWIWLCEQGCIVRDDGARPIRVVRHMTDITTQREAEERLKDDDRRKDQFLAMLAHELRNPLAPIRNVVGVLQQRNLTDREFAWGRDVISRQTEHLARLVDDLIDVSRITRDRLALRKERIEISEIIQSAVESSRHLIDEADLELIVALPTHRIHMEADRVRLTQVLMNLLNNAAKFTARGGTIRVSASGDGTPGSEVVIRVSDTGIGIERDKIERLFDMFYQAGSSPDWSYRGLGIGLTLVQRLVELHGGTVQADSAGPGQGSEFVIRLPILVQLNRSSEVDTPKTADAGNGARGQKVLIADDNFDAAESLAMLLRHRGYNVQTTHDGVEAVTAANWFRPEVAFLDIGMPGMTGFDVARRIRETPWGQSVSLVALTGWGQDEDRRRARDAGFDAHLVKPVDVEALFKLLSDANERLRPLRTAEA